MALTQTLAQMRSAVRRETDTEGEDALVRHPDADLNDAVNRGLAALHRILVRTRGDQNYLSYQTISTVVGTSTYALAAAFMHLINVETTIDGRKVWLQQYIPSEHAILTDTNLGWTGRPLYYALRGGDTIDLLPSPQAVYAINITYVPVPTTLVANGDTLDTIARLDDYVVWYASREVATKDKAFDLVAALTAKLAEIRGDIESIARGRDQNNPRRMVDEALQIASLRRQGFRFRL